MSALDWIAKWADHTPGKTAVTSYDTHEKYTYEALDRYANRLKARFLELGLREGDRVGVLAEHSPEYIVLFCTCQRMGLILVPLNYRLSAGELSALVSDCSPKLLLYSINQQYKLEQLSPVRCILLSIPEIRSCYKADAGICAGNYEIKEDNPLFIFYTSGTTGTPKGVVYTNKMLFWNSLNTSMQLGITSADSTINVLPPYHTSGWNVLVTPLLHKGAHVGMLEKFDPEKTLCLLELHHTTLFMALPTMLHMMQKTAVFNEVHLEHLRYIVSGGEAVSPG
ncbi:MAG: acyl--CoA ligase, partial [Sinomicrobium sp.]|nr:acyl--CoA ligase [Sinomicrobium sp.]